MNKDEIVASLRFRAHVKFDGHKKAGRTGPDWALSQEMETMAADLIEEQAKVIETLTKALKGVLDEHTYEAPAGNTNCRFCDNDMDHEGTFEDMHDPDCIIHSVRSAVALSKALPSES